MIGSGQATVASSKESLPPSPLRRFDSLAVLLQGDDACGAACFDGDLLLVTTNSEEKSQLVRSVLRYLKASAAFYSQKTTESKETWQQEYNRLLEIVGKTSLYKNNTEYSQRFDDALQKVTTAIRLAYEQPTHEHAWPQDVVKAIAENKILFLNHKKLGSMSKHYDPDEHAEMKILSYLVFHSNLKDNNNQFYIGISKRCCLQCMSTIQLANVVLEREVIKVRDESHNNYFRANPPSLFRVQKDELDEKTKEIIDRLEKMLLKVKEAASIKAVFDCTNVINPKQLHDLSPPIPIILDDASDASFNDTGYFSSSPPPTPEHITNLALTTKSASLGK